MKSLVRIIRFTRDLYPYYGIIAISAILVSLASIVLPFIFGRATDVVAAAVSGAEPTNTAIRMIVWLAVGILVAELVNTVFTNVGGYFGDIMSNRMRTILSTRYYRKLLSLPQSWFDTELTGTIISRLNRSITEVTQFAKNFSNMISSMLLTTVAVLVITAFYAWPITVLLLIVFPVYIWLTALTSTHWQDIEGQKNELVDTASGRFSEVVGQIRVVKSFVAERHELKSFTQKYEETDDLTKKQARHWHNLDIARRAFLNIIFFAIYILIFVYTIRGTFSIGDMVLLIQLVSMVNSPVQTMNYIIDTAQRAIAGSKDYFDVMDSPVDPRVADSLQLDSDSDSDVIDNLPEPVAGEPMISFDSVDFAYEGNDDVLHDVTFDVQPGEKVALVGESGGGKSTIVNVLLGLYEAHDGVVKVGGRSITDLDLAELRHTIGVVFQDASLFSGTIRENIAYGRPQASDDDVRAAAQRANASDFIEKFPDGYETVIGERGMRLSGGQRQRVAVARAILKDAPILVLDEATSALDTKAERQVQEGLDELMANRTSLIIAHRLSTIAGVDRIVTLRDGRVDEIGTPTALANSGGIYAELLRLQNEGAKKQLARFDITG